MTAQGANPFQYLLPVAPSAFVGRWPLVQAMAHNLIRDEGDSHALIAGRRCGKSSLLGALAHALRGQPVRTGQGDWLALPLLFDFKATNFDGAGAFFAHILGEARRQVDVSARRRPPDAWPTPVALTAPWFQQLAAQPSLPLRDFEDALGYLLEQLATDQTPVRLVLLLDEVDEVLDRAWRDDLFNQLRALVYSGDLKSCVRLVVAGSRRLLEQVSSRGSPLNNILVRHFLTVFDAASFQELSARAPTIPASVADAVWQQSGGHPFLAQYLFYQLWMQAGGSGLAATDAMAVEALVARFQAEHATDLDGWATGIEAVGARAYRLLPPSPAWLTEAALVAQLVDPPSAVKRGLTALCYHGLARHDNWSRYQCAGALFRTWASRYAVGVADAASVSPAARPVSFAALRTCLRALYEDADDARRLAHDVGLDLGQINFEAKPINLWHALLGQARKEDKIAALVALASQEFSEQAQEIQQAYQADVGSG